jgi:hypothetical protein
MTVYRNFASGDLGVVDISSPGSRSSKTRIRNDDLRIFIEDRTRHTGEKAADVIDASGEQGSLDGADL